MKINQKGIKLLLLVFVFQIAVLHNSWSQHLAYHSAVNKAEIFITEEKFNDAILVYKQLYDQYPIYTIDIYNALVCAIFAKKEEDIKFFGKLLSEKGIPENFFLKKAVFKTLQNQSYWREYAKQSQSKHDSIVSKNKTFIKSIDSILLAEDSIQNLVLNFSFENIDSVTFVNKLSKSNQTALLDLFDKNFFPGENLISLYIRNDTILSYTSSFFKMLNSAQQSKFNSINKTIEQEESIFLPLMEKELLALNIKPATFALPLDLTEVRSLNERKFYGTIDVFAKKQNDLYAYKQFYENIENKLIITFNRKYIGLESLDDMLKKIKFNQKSAYKNVFEFPIFWTYILEEKMDLQDYIKLK